MHKQLHPTRVICVITYPRNNIGYIALEKRVPGGTGCGQVSFYIINIVCIWGSYDPTMVTPSTSTCHVDVGVGDVIIVGCYDSICYPPFFVFVVFLGGGWHICISVHFLSFSNTDMTLVVKTFTVVNNRLFVCLSNIQLMAWWCYDPGRHQVYLNRIPWICVLLFLPRRVKHTICQP